MLPKLTEKGNLLPVIILLAALAILFALFKSPLRHKISSLVTQKTTTVTSNYQQPSPSALKTDQSKKNTNQKDVTFNKLTFKVPSVYQSGYLGGGTTFAIDPQPIPSTAPYGDFTPAFSLELIKNKTIDKAKQEFLNQQGYKDKETSNITVDGMPALKTTQVLPAGQDVVDHHIEDLYISVGQDLYHFNSFDLHISSTDQQKYFDQIVETFKFSQ